MLLAVRFPPHIGSAALFCPQNETEICSSPNQMAAFTERSVTPVPHHMTFASLRAVAAKGAPPVHAKTRAPLLGGSTAVASQVPEEKLIFLFKLLSRQCVSETQIWSREHGVCEERSIKEIGWSRVGPCSWCKFIHCEIQQEWLREDV